MTGKVHIWPVMESDPDRPRQGEYAVQFGKNWPVNALSVTLIPQGWAVYLNGFLVAVDHNWRKAFGKIARGRTMLLGRPVNQTEYQSIIEARRADILAGVNLEQPINHNGVRPPF